MPAKTERVSAEGDPEELQRLVAQAVESHLRRLVVGLLELHDRPADAAALVDVRDEAQAVASALLTVDLDQLSRAARAISDTLDSLAATGAAVPTGAVVALLDATAGLRSLVAARGEPPSANRGPESLEPELAALAPWHPMTAALRAASGAAGDAGSPSRRGGRSTAAASAASPDQPASSSSSSSASSSAASADEGAIPESWIAAATRRDGAARDRLRVVQAIDLRATTDRIGAQASDPAALADLLGGLTQLADVLLRTTESLEHRLAELAELPELTELDEAVQAFSRARSGRTVRSEPGAAAAPDRRRPR